MIQKKIVNQSYKKNIQESTRRKEIKILKMKVEYPSNNLIKNVLEQIKKSKPCFLEKLIVDLLVKMGYGGLVESAVTRVGKSYDEGIDGIIKEDKLGLNLIYFQTKRWKNVVGRPLKFRNLSEHWKENMLEKVYLLPLLNFQNLQ